MHSSTFFSFLLNLVVNPPLAFRRKRPHPSERRTSRRAGDLDAMKNALSPAAVEEEIVAAY